MWPTDNDSCSCCQPAWLCAEEAEKWLGKWVEIYVGGMAAAMTFHLLPRIFTKLTLPAIV